MEDVDFNELKEQDRQLKRTINGVARFVETFSMERHENQIDVRLELLEDAMRRFHVVQRKIKVILDEEDLELKPESKETDGQRDKRVKSKIAKREADFDEAASQVEEVYCAAKSSLLAFKCKKPVSVESSETSTSSVMSRVKLPEIQLPHFSGRIRDWVTFRDMFQSLIHNNDQLSPIDKFTYLRSSVTDEALQEISSIELTAANYQVAWNVLEKRYENKKLIVKAHLDALFAIEPIRREHSESLNRLISDFDKNLQMLDKIGEKTESWSTLLAHMVSMRLDPVTLRQWETHHNSKEVPTYANLMNFLRDQCLVLQSLVANNPSEPHYHRLRGSPETEYRRFRNTTTHLTSQPPERCVFCGQRHNNIFQCSNMKDWSVPQRISEVQKRRLCLNCLRPDHFAINCTRGKCKICSFNHHTLLHVESSRNFARPTSPNYSSSVSPSRNRPDSANQRESNHWRQSPRPQRTHNQTSRPSTNSYPVIQAPNPQVNPQHTTDNLSHTFEISQKSNGSLSQQVLLSTAVVRVEDRYGNHTFARTLLDSCSEFCYVTSSFAQKLNLHESSETLKVQGIGNVSVTSRRAVEAKIQPRLSTISSFCEIIRFHVLPNITQTLPIKPVPIQLQNSLPNVVLADPDFWKPGSIDMIIGAEYFFELLKQGCQRFVDNGPSLQNSVFGWIVSGKMSVHQSENVSENQLDMQSVNYTSNNSHRTATFVSSSAHLEDLISKFWELESCHNKSTYSIEESACEEHFKSTTRRDSDGKFLVTLPKKPGVIQQLGDSRNSAIRRFIGLEKRFNANPELKAMYVEFIHEYMLMGHMREVTEQKGQNESSQNFNCQISQKSESVVYYLPHHAVLKPDSTTTKLRVVFDASCRTSTGVSLNDGLMVGPVVQNDLMSIILRFRLHRYAISADVEKMYRMVRVQIPDQHLQRILWRDSPNDPIKTYELTTVTYGTASAPYLATRCLKMLGEENVVTHPIGSRVILEDFYVDDCLTGADTLEEAKTIIKETTFLTDSAGFNLRKFNSNSSKILSKLPNHMLDKRRTFELDSSSSTVKTLGMKWDTSEDEFCFSFPQMRSSESAITKRIVHSDAACLFDPLGLVGPVVVQAKIFIQQLWRLKKDWDEPLDESFQKFWIEYKQNLLVLAYISVPRWVGFSPTLESVQLHGFCDASEQAYGACLYLRCVKTDGSITVRLITSKSRVAPLENLKQSKRKTSIPRLELSSALVLSHLYERFTQVHPNIVETYFWTDSMIVRHWLASPPSRWQMFVANRVSEIQHITKNGKWNHVAGIENPADLISRGASPEQLIKQSLWFDGPTWLSQEQQLWPTENDESSTEIDASLLEEKPSTALVTHENSTNEIFELHDSFISLTRIVALFKRFRHNAQKVNRNNHIVGNLSQAELSEASLTLVRLSQAESFAAELSDLKKHGEVKPSSRIAGLDPYLHEGAIRARGRLRHAHISASRKHPWILDHRHPLTVSIVRDFHLRQFHAGQQLLISSVREQFWPTNMAGLARTVIHSCVPCFKTKPKVVEQIMGDLPAVRVTEAFPFSRVGVDYCGPFCVSYPNRRASPVKCYVAVFVCLVIKAVHLELVMDLTSQAFIAAFRRFVGRRSKPELVMCDNATTFVGASRELKELARMFHSKQFQESVVRDASDQGIEFKFIPPRTPNFGGLWEAQVKSFKTHFKKSVGLRTLSVDEMITALAQIEAVLNSRPLTQLSSDPSDFRALTPGHFLVQRPMTALPDRDLTNVNTNRLTMWQRAQQLTQQFWKKWNTQYLSDLQNRTKWSKEQQNLDIGMMVLLKEENCPPQRWPLGRIENVVRGQDGKVRVVSVRTQNGTYDRGISKICLLPIRDNNNVDNASQ
ncbi:uncharacterized protein LOC129752361 [Uranotaenia lowii]|uniref:uncharacterized protein LOC129752361 n=1 Tax=Uranotaenia lowii TaxID=190385 RepID=UPI00247A079E|nr:uncharacterized protein LOC129752361 [Uranotaenia lowii]